MTAKTVYGWTHDGQRAFSTNPKLAEDPMSGIEWLPGARWMVCDDAGSVAQDKSSLLPRELPDDGTWITGTSDGEWITCGQIDKSWAAQNWRTSLRENPAYRNNPDTWETGDVVRIRADLQVKEDPPKQAAIVGRAGKTLFELEGRRSPISGLLLELVRRHWEAV